jgi:L-fuconolactonase
MRALPLLLLAACAAPMPAHIIDTHIHLYDPARPEGVPWPSKTDPVLFRPVLPAEFRALARAHGVAAAVVVEASPWVEDNRWLLDLVRGDALFPAVVGNLAPGTPDFATHLARFAADPRFVGIRAKPKLDDKTMADLRLLAERGKSLDVLGPNLEDVAELARRLPTLTIVLDHLAGGQADGRAPDPGWTSKLRAAAAHPNVFCKLSGLDQQAGLRPAPASLEHYRPLLDVLWAAFGEDRLIYGSNWPVTLLRTDPGTHQGWVLDYVRPRGQAALDKVFWRNALRAYRFALPASR